MKKRILKSLFAMICMLCSISVSAYDFRVDRIYYNITSATELTCEVTSGSSKYSGAVVIPQEAVYNGNIYKVTSIGESAFAYCSGLESVVIPNSVTSIGSYAFYDCSGLESVVIPNSVTSIGLAAFYGCSGLTSIVIPNSVTSIGSYAFYDCSGLESVVIPNSVTSIGESAFAYCSGLSSVVIGSGVISANNIFGGNNPAKVIWLPNTPPSGYGGGGKVNYVANSSYNFNWSTTYIYDHLSSMFESDGVIYVPVNPAERTCDIIDCSYSEKANAIDVEKTVNYKGIAMNVVNIRPYAFYDNDYIKSLKINFFGEIPNYAFYDCDFIPEVHIGSEITNIGNDAFYSCSGLTSATISNQGDIGNDAFSDCSSLAYIDLRNTGSIGTSAFSGCTSAASLRIAPTVTAIGDYAFSGCKKIGDVTIEDRETELTLGSNGNSPLFSDCPLDEVYIGGKIKYNTNSNYGYSPFYRNTSLRTVTITDTETTVYDNEFYGCTNLKNVKIGNGVTSFGMYAFSGCSAIEAFEFGSHVETIGAEAFSDCTSMTKLVSHNPVPPVCGNEALDDINKWECTLYVPATAAEAYKGADQWKNFFFVDDVANYVPTAIDKTVATGNEKTETARYDMSGRRVTKSYKGLVIIRYADGTTAKMMK